MICPNCNKPGAEECAEEVDIGVGIQKHVWGYDCPECGQISLLSCCGNLETHGHTNWCNYATGN